VLIEKNASTFGNKMVCLGFWYLKETCYPVGRRGIHYKGTLELLNQFPWSCYSKACGSVRRQLLCNTSIVYPCI